MTTAPWLSIVGIGEDGLDGISAAARRLIDAAALFVGGERHLAMLPDDGRPKRPWPSPLTHLVDEIVSHRGQPVCVLATGDPMWFGIGVTLLRRVPVDETVVIPAPSAFALACARLGWPLTSADTLTLHGRPLETVIPWLQPGARLLLLGNDDRTPADLARLLTAQGFGPSPMTVLSRMGGLGESRTDGNAEVWPAATVDPFHTIAVVCRPAAEARWNARTPGLADDAFDHDGQMTKREVRAVTLAQLAPAPGARLWDVGAGSGSVAIEWLRCDPRSQAIAIEPRADRRDAIARNAERLGVPRLEIVSGSAPAALAGLAPPDAVFLGGGASVPGVIDACWNALPAGGRLVANAVTLEGEAAITAARTRLGGALSRLAVSRAEPVGPFTGWRPLMPVTQWSAIKP